MLPQSNDTFNYKKGTYLTFKTDPTSGQRISPYIDLNNEKILFYNKDNTNPLEFLNSQVKASFNNPESFQTVILNNTIRQALGGKLDIGELRRFILICSLVCAGIVAGIMFFINQGGF
jgi:hypothetical protein